MPIPSWWFVRICQKEDANATGGVIFENTVMKTDFQPKITRRHYVL